MLHMARRSESLLAFFALLLLLSLTLLYGCRAFDPEPPVINRAPQTYVTGAPAETTGTGFTRHMFWYGTDTDGEVVQFIYAITDSTIRDLEDGQNRDEEDDRFNPADDVTTLETNEERFVGWTTKTDSIFEFTVDRGPTSSKDMTFHIVAVDDRGAIDPTPARLYFFNNSLGNPRLVFHLFVDVGSAVEPVWESRWSGDHRDAEPGSPEGTGFPFAGFERRFRFEWEASSPNGGIIGYRYRVRQGLGEYIPASILGQKQWDPEGTSFVFGNTDPPSPALGSSCADDASGCDPALVRFPSGNYNISIEALDVYIRTREIAGIHPRHQHSTGAIGRGFERVLRLRCHAHRLSIERPQERPGVIDALGKHVLTGVAAIAPDNNCTERPIRNHTNIIKTGRQCRQLHAIR